MTNQQVLTAINDARVAIREYKNGKSKKDQTSLDRLKQLIEEQQIETSTKEFIKEAFELQAEGTPCPTCGGSGVI